MELKEVKKHIGERVYVESKKAYNQHKGEYILEGIMQVCELGFDDKAVWTVKIKLRQINANCSIWIDFKGAVIELMQNTKCSDTQEQTEGLRTIEVIQKESLEKLKTLCQ